MRLVATRESPFSKDEVCKDLVGFSGEKALGLNGVFMAY